MSCSARGAQPLSLLPARCCCRAVCTRHALGRIVRFLDLPPADKAHRALADAQMTAHLLLRMQHDLQTRWHIPQPAHRLLQHIQSCQRQHVPALLQRTSELQTQPQLPGMLDA